MKLGFSTVMYEETSLSYPDIVGKAATLDYDGIELNFKVWPCELDVGAIEDSLNRLSVEIAAVGTRHLHSTHGLYLASPRRDARKRALSYVEDCMKLARRLDCSLVQAGWAFQGSRLEASHDVVWSHAVESLKEVGKLGGDYGVRFVIEFACKQNAELVNTMDGALRMLDEVGCENILVMADIFHIYMEKGSFRDTVLKAGRKLGYVHLADSDRLTPGRAEINFEEFIDALGEINYEGYMTMEFDPVPSPDESLEEALEYIRRLL